METSLSDEWAFNLSRHKFLRSNPIFFFLRVCSLSAKYVTAKKKILKSKNVNTAYEDGFNYKDDKEFLLMSTIEIEWNFLRR